MKQVLQNLKTGETSLTELPRPSKKKGFLLIETKVTLLSPGTEKMLVDFGKSNILSKVRKQPKKAKQVIDKLRTDGLISTYEAIDSKLSTPIPLGYCNVGTVIDVGEGVDEFSIGDRVVSNGPHAEIVSVPKNLCAKIPDDISDNDASFVILGAIALQGIRLSKPTLGECFVVIGLGVIGLLSVQILKAYGCKVLAVDINEERLGIAKELGAITINSKKNNNYHDTVRFFSEGYGADGVIITTATDSNEVISDAANISRKRGRVILVGVAGLNLSRDDFYEKELSFQVSCSYGPGRYDKKYEEGGEDYPIGYVRWTEQRNFKAILDLMKSKSIKTNHLITSIAPFKEAPSIYSMLSKGDHGLGMLLKYENQEHSIKNNKVQIEEKNIRSLGDPEITAGFVGAGNYASRILMPNFKKLGISMHTVVTESGLSGTIHGKKHGFNFSSTDIDSVLNEKKINTVVIATRHDTHADLVIKAMRSKKNIFIEKPLAISMNDLNKIKKEYYGQIGDSKNKFRPHIMIGFNRRFSPHTIKMKSLLSTINGPKSYIFTMNAGYIPESHWVHDIKIGGGRIIGEACHYIDLMRFLSNSKITNISAQSMKNNPNDKQTNDTAVLSLSFEDGSVGSINYFSNGSPSFEKEKLDVYASGKILSLNNFKSLKGFGWENFKTFKTITQNKGQNNCIKSFALALKNGKPAIPINEIFEVTEMSIRAAESIRNDLT